MTSSKVAYLSKYITKTETDDNDDENRNKSRKHHHKKKSKKTQRHQEVTLAKTDFLIDIDNDVDIPSALPSVKQSDRDAGNNFRGELNDSDDDGEDENEPVVVVDIGQPNEIVSSEPHIPRGTWESETLRVDDHDNSPQPRRRRRHDSDTTTASSQCPPPNTANHMETDIVADHPPRRRRHDSSSDDSSNNDSDKNTSNRSDIIDTASRKNQRRRHDSDSEDDVERVISSHIQPRRRRHDSTSEEESIVEKSHSKRNNNSDHEHRRKRRKRHDSSDSSNDYENDSHRPQAKERMSSGHKAGIQTSTDFTRREVKLQQKKRDETSEFARQHGSGGAETIYRDRESGKKLTDQQLLQQPRSDRKNQVVLSIEEQRILNTGRVQVEQEERMRHEFQKIQESQFARHRDDSELDNILKSKIHADDPMAAYAMKQKKQQQSTTSMPVDGDNRSVNPQLLQRPTYKGPLPKPNRYNIPPGYRWDARDRGNGFEDKLLAKKYNTDHQNEQAYRYSSADM